MIYKEVYFVLLVSVLLMSQTDALLEDSSVRLRSDVAGTDDDMLYSEELRDKELPKQRSTKNEEIDGNEGSMQADYSFNEENIRAFVPENGLGESGGNAEVRTRRYTLTDSPPRFRFTPPEQTVSPGSPVTLKCAVEGTPTPSITWTRDGQNIIPTLGTSVGSYVSNGLFVISHVNISSVSQQDGGLITCAAMNDLGSISSNTRLNIYGPPFIRGGLRNISAVEGEDAMLWCPAGGFPLPKVIWSRGGSKLAATLRHENLQNNSLLIKNVHKQDSGSYTCSISSHHGHSLTGKVHLFVYKPPEIEKFWFPEGQEEGRRSQLTCMVTAGDLPLTISWYKNGHHLSHDLDREVKHMSEYSSVLLFKKISEHHSGDYTCVASNVAASVNHTAKLIVKVAPRWSIPPSDSRGLVGTDISLDCYARGSPKPTIEWAKAPGKEPKNFQSILDTSSLLNSRTQSIRQLNNGSLYIKNLKLSDKGFYLCRASNGIGLPLENYIKLEVHAGAKIISKGGKKTGHSGHTSSLSCEATGDLPLTIQWSKEGVPVHGGGRFHVDESFSQLGKLSSSLRITSLQAEDRGEYRCTAINERSTDIAVFTLIVLEPPSPPDDFIIKEINSQSAVVEWNQNQPNTVLVQYKEGSSSWGWKNVTSPAWSSDLYLRNLKPFTTYKLRLLSQNELGFSDPTLEKTFTTMQTAPTNAPKDVRVISASTNSLAIAWRPPPSNHLNGPLRGYKIVLKQQNSHGHTVTITRPTDSTSVAQENKYTVTGLEPGTLYEVGVRAFNSAGMGPMSSPRIVKPTKYPSLKCPPTEVNCRGTGPETVRVIWSSPSAHCSQKSLILGYKLSAIPTTTFPSVYENNIFEITTTNLEKSVSGLRAATNVSVQVRAYNEEGEGPPSVPIFCTTYDAVPDAPRRLKGVSTGVSSIVVRWESPFQTFGTLLHYTLYSQTAGQDVKRDLIAAGNIDSTWRELTGLPSRNPIKVWISATNSAGEGRTSDPISITPKHSPTHPPLTLGGGKQWWVTENGGVTLGCRRIGLPSPTVEWVKQSQNKMGVQNIQVIRDSELEQILPGGDLHISDVLISCNYTCIARNSMGTDKLTHILHVTSPPEPPKLEVIKATSSSINITLLSYAREGATILGYRLYYRLPSGSWEEISVVPSTFFMKGTISISDLPCGTPIHFYGVAWNHYGSSSASGVLVVPTAGSLPPKPKPQDLFDINDTCVILKLYAWPETVCRIDGWKVEQREADSRSREWQVIGSPITRDMTDFPLCDLDTDKRHVLKITALSEPGPTAVLYKVKTGNTDLLAFDQLVQEIVYASPVMPQSILEAPLIAGVISAILLSIAVFICLLVAYNRRKALCNTENQEDIQSNADDNYLSLKESMKKYKAQETTPTKKKKSQSIASLATQEILSDSYDIYPYATFQGNINSETLQYGLSVQGRSSSRECLDSPRPRDYTLVGYSTTERMNVPSKNFEMNENVYGRRKDQIIYKKPTGGDNKNNKNENSEAWIELDDAYSKRHRNKKKSRHGPEVHFSETESNQMMLDSNYHQHYAGQSNSSDKNTKMGTRPPVPIPSLDSEGRRKARSSNISSKDKSEKLERNFKYSPVAVPKKPNDYQSSIYGYNNSTNSSSNESALSSGRVYRPPSEFGDHRIQSDAECDQEGEILSDQNVRSRNLCDKSGKDNGVSSGIERNCQDLTDRELVVQLDETSGRESSTDSLMMSNNMYGRTTDTICSGNTLQSESELSNYSINV